MFIARQRLGKLDPAATNKQLSRYCWAITMEKMFSMGSDPRLYNEDPRPAEMTIEGVS
jgi:hypothetical protein